MRLVRARNSMVVDYLAPVVLDDPDCPKEVFLETLRAGLRNNIDNFFVAMAYDDTKTELVCEGYIIAANSPVEPFVYIIQAWMSPKAENKTKQVFTALKLWAESKGKKQIQMDTSRDHAAFTRRWGFKVVSYRMSCDLEQLNELDENSNVQDTHAGPAESSGSSVELPGQGTERPELANAADTECVKPIPVSDATGESTGDLVG